MTSPTPSTVRIARSRQTQEERNRALVARTINRYGLTFPETIRAMRHKYGKSTYQINKGDGLAGGTFSRIETGKRLPSRDMIERIADVLGANDHDRTTLLRSAGYLGDHDLAALNHADLSAIAKRLNDPATPETVRAHTLTMLRAIRATLERGLV